MLSVKMVATRRGTRVTSPVKTTDDVATEPPGSVRRIRSRVIVTDQPQSEQTSDSQQDDEVQNAAPSEPKNPTKRETRRSKRHPTDANQPDSTHEADVSESESCCSVASGVAEPVTTRSRRRATGRERPTAAMQKDASEGESCSSPPVSKTRRSMRSQKKPVSTPAESTTLQDDNHSEAESCSSVASLSKVIETRRITRSRRRTAVPSGGEDPSDSCSSAVSGPQGSTIRRSTRNRRTQPTEPIPICLEESEPSKASASSTPTRTRRGKGTVKSGDDNRANDSEGCHSGPSTSPKRLAGVFVVDSDSESVATNCTSVDSPCSVRVRHTPSSSRTGSASSNRAVPASRTRSKVTVTHDVANVTSAASKGDQLNSKESKLAKDEAATPMDTVSDGEGVEEMDEEDTNRTVIRVDDGECSILGNVTLTLDEDEDVISSKKNELAKDQMETPVSTVSDQEDAQVVDEEETIRTVIRANRQECSFSGNITLTLDEDEEEDVISSANAEATMMKSESRQETSSVKGVTVSENTENMEVDLDIPEQIETKKDAQIMEDSENITEPAAGDEVELVSEVQGTDGQLSALVMKPEKGVIVTKEDQQNLVGECDTEDQKSSDPAQTEKFLTVVVESKGESDANATVLPKKPSKLAEESVKVSKDVKVCEAADVRDVPQKASPSQTVTMNSDVAGQKVEEEREIENHTDVHAGHHESELEKKVQDGSPATTAEEEPSSSSKAQEDKTSIQQTKSKKAMLSLLDSSEDEESDDEGLSDEGCKEDAGDLESEDEAMDSDENQPGPSRKPDEPHNGGLFVIDTRPGLQSSEKYYIDTTRHDEVDHVGDSKAVEDEEDFVDEEGDDDDDDNDSKTLFTSRKPAMMKLSSAIDPGLKMKELGGLYISFDGSKSKTVSNNLKKLKDQKNQDELLKNSVIVADFEKKDAVPPYKESKHATKLKRKEERAKTTGDGWFNMKAPELTDELRNDLKALKMRSAMDPKRFYKKNDREGFPKYFQVGTVVDNPADFYHSRIPKKQRKRTIVEELLADAEFRSFNKRKYQEIMSEKAAEAAGKMNKKKHTFHKKK